MKKHHFYPTPYELTTGNFVVSTTQNIGQRRSRSAVNIVSLLKVVPEYIQKALASEAIGSYPQSNPRSRLSNSGTMKDPDSAT